MDEQVKPTRAERKALKAQQREAAILVLKQIIVKAPAELSAWGVVRTRAWAHLHKECVRLSSTRRVKAERLSAAAAALQGVATASLEHLNSLLNPEPKPKTLRPKAPTVQAISRL